MIPALMAAEPLVKWGVLIGGPIVLLTASHSCVAWTYYDKGAASVKQEWDASIAIQAAESNRQIVQAKEMEARVVIETAKEERVIQAKAEDVKKEVVHHAKRNPKPLSTAVVSIYDRLISVPNETGHRLPAADPGTGAPEIPRGRVAVEATTALQDEDGNTIELTTDELAQAAVDFAEKYALMKNAYQGLSEWNDGREAIELERLTRK